MPFFWIAQAMLAPYVREAMLPGQVYMRLNLRPAPSMAWLKQGASMACEIQKNAFHASDKCRLWDRFEIR